MNYQLNYIPLNIALGLNFVFFLYDVEHDLTFMFTLNDIVVRYCRWVFITVLINCSLQNNQSILMSGRG